jgi:hypothetical protein
MRVVADRHAFTATSADHDPLQQCRALACRSTASLGAPGERITLHALEVQLILFPSWVALALKISGGKTRLSEADLQIVHKAVVSACDMNDGIRDGLIGDPRACHFELEDLTCKGATRSQCLSSEQIAALRKIYSGPTTSAGKRIYADGELMFGSELAFW